MLLFSYSSKISTIYGSIVFSQSILYSSLFVPPETVALLSSWLHSSILLCTWMQKFYAFVFSFSSTEESDLPHHSIYFPILKNQPIHQIIAFLSTFQHTFSLLQTDHEDH